MNFLFVCNQGMHRSRTAAEIYSKEHETKHCGIYSENNPLTKELLEWADNVFVMEEAQRKFIGEHFPKQYLAKKILLLNIPDVYSYNQEELIKLIKEEFKKVY